MATIGAHTPRASRDGLSPQAPPSLRGTRRMNRATCSIHRDRAGARVRLPFRLPPPVCPDPALVLMRTGIGFC